jgi:hypothetical protein
MIRNEGEDQEILKEGLGGMVDQQGSPSRGGGHKLIKRDLLNKIMMPNLKKTGNSIEKFYFACN